MRRYTIEVGAGRYVIDVEELTLERFQVYVGGQSFEVRLAADEQLGGQAITPAIVPLGGAPATSHELPVVLPARPAEPAADPGAGGRVSAPLPGTILAVVVAPGDNVEAGQPLLTLEAMKMQNTLRSPRAGVVSAVLVRPGQAVTHGETLVELAEVSE